MPKPIKKLPIIAKRREYRRAADYLQWFNGKWWRFDKGADYDDYAQAYNKLYQMARKLGYSLEIRHNGDKTQLFVRATKIV